MDGKCKRNCPDGKSYNGDKTIIWCDLDGATREEWEPCPHNSPIRYAKGEGNITCGTIHITENEQRHAAVCRELTELYRKKNADYGDSFHKSWEDYGITMAAIRIGDKYNRLRNLTAGKGAPNLVGESVRDTLIDLANYAIMSVIELDAEGTTI